MDKSKVPRFLLAHHVFICEVTMPYETVLLLGICMSALQYCHCLYFGNVSNDVSSNVYNSRIGASAFAD